MSRACGGQPSDGVPRAGPGARDTHLMSRPMLRRLAPTLALMAALTGCGSSGVPSSPVAGLRGQSGSAGERLGFPGFATKNTTRVAGADPVADAAAVARAVFPSLSPSTRPDVV